MTQLQITAFGAPSVLRLNPSQDKVPAEGEVRVRIRQRLVNVDYRTLRHGAMAPALRTQFARFLHAKDTP